MGLSEYEETLLSGWEDVYKKGQVTMWTMLALKDGSKHMADIKTFIATMTKDTVTADDQSMYRALRRYNDAELIDFRNEPSESGPDRKMYFLTEIGERVVQAFLQRNIIDVYYDDAVRRIVDY